MQLPDGALQALGSLLPPGLSNQKAIPPPPHIIAMCFYLLSFGYFERMTLPPPHMPYMGVIAPLLGAPQYRIGGLIEYIKILKKKSEFGQ